MKNLFLELLTYFIIYSFFGWVMESIVRSISEKRIINTGFLKGPVCPIYGIGAIIMFLFLNRFEDRLILLFFISIIILTLWEYIVGFLLEKTFNMKYWDYSDQKFNYKGRICLVNSICWGILGVVFVKFIHPFVESVITKIDVKLVYYIFLILGLVMMIDFISTVVKIKNIKETLDKIEKINKEIIEKLKELRKLKKETKEEEEKRTITESTIEIIEELKKKRNRITHRLYKNVYRLKKAFPTINTKEITEILSKKIDIRKNKKKTLENK